MPHQQGTAFRLGGRVQAQPGIGEHLTQRHAGCFQTSEKVDPGEDRGVVVTMFRLVASRIGQKPDPLVWALNPVRSASSLISSTAIPLRCPNNYFFERTPSQAMISAFA